MEGRAERNLKGGMNHMPMRGFKATVFMILCVVRLCLSSADVYRKGFSAVISDPFEAWGIILPVVYLLIWFFAPRLMKAKSDRLTAEQRERQKKFNRISAVAVGIVFLALAGVIVMDEAGLGPKVRTPARADMREASLTMVRQGKASEIEVSMLDVFSGDAVFNTDGFVSAREAPEEPEEYLRIRCVQKDGKERVFSLFNQEDYLYLKEQDAGSWRVRRSKAEAAHNGYGMYARTYLKFALEQSLLAGKEYGFSGSDPFPEGVIRRQRERYDGAGKAIWVETKHAVSYPMYDDYIPETYMAHCVEDVRFVFIHGDSLSVCDFVTGERTSVPVVKTASGTLDFESTVAGYCSAR